MDINSVFEDATNALGITIDNFQREDAELEQEVKTDPEDLALDTMIGGDGADFITGRDIEDIDNGRTPEEEDPIVDDAKRALKDKEIVMLANEINADSSLSKKAREKLDEGASVLDFVGSMFKEENNIDGYAFPMASDTVDPTLNDDDSDEYDEKHHHHNEEKECPVCHCSPCVCDDSSIDEDDDDDDEDDHEERPIHTHPFAGIKGDGDDDDDDDQSLEDEDDDIDDECFTQEDSDDDEDDDDKKDEKKKCIKKLIKHIIEKYNKHEKDEDDEEDDDSDDDGDEDDDDKKEERKLEDDPFRIVVVHHIPSTINISSDAPDNEPAGPVQPIADTKNHNGFSYGEGAKDMFEDLLNESMFEDEDTLDIFKEEKDTSTEKKFVSDDDVDNLCEDDMSVEELNDIQIFNKFEGSDINAPTSRQGTFLTGVKNNVDEPVIKYNNQDSLSHTGALFDAESFFSDIEDDSIDDMKL